jgi:flagellar biosynthetic protein FlhB
MADNPASEKTEKPTPRRLQKARSAGQVPQSQELAAAVTLLVLLVSLAILGPNLFAWCKSRVESGIIGETSAFETPTSFLAYQNKTLADALLIMLPILAAMCVAGVVSSMIVGGWTLTTKSLEFKWDMINPASVVQRAFNTRSLVRLLMSIAKLAFISLIVWIYLRGRFETLAVLRWAWSTQLLTALSGIIFGLGLRIAIAALVLGIADAVYQKWHYTEDLKITRQEVKQEHRDTEGDPKIKSRIRRIQFQMSLKRMRQQVPKASVILVNPTHVAVALRYDAKTMEAPVLLAKGADLMAQRIMEIGRSYGIPIVRRPPLARAIFASVKPGQSIPESLYMAVAEVLAMIYRLRQRKRAAARG